MTRADKILIMMLVALVVCSIPLTRVIANERLEDVVILTSPYGDTSIDFASDFRRTIDIEGNQGVVVFEATAAGFRAVQSSCDDQVCVEAGVLSASNPIVCASNGVAAFLTGSEGGYDAVTR